jgi:5-methylcytosine-specific restriction endonuclease McrA
MVVVAESAATQGALALPKPPRRSPKPRRPIARRVRPRHFRDSELARLERQADAAARRAARERYGPWCLFCAPATARATDTAHGIRRAFRRTRWTLTNLYPACRECHDFFGKRPALWRRVRVDHRGQEVVERDEQLAYREPAWKPTVSELRELIARLQRREVA